MQTIDELKYSQSVWGFQPRKAEIRKVCEVKGLLRNRNHLDVSKDRFRQRCQIVPLVRKTLKCPDCGTEILLSSTGRARYVQGLPNGKLLTFFRLCVHQCWCHRCPKSFYESFPFLSSPKARITKALEQLILKLRAEMSIKGIAEGDHPGDARLLRVHTDRSNSQSRVTAQEAPLHFKRLVSLPP